MEGFIEINLRLDLTGTALVSRPVSMHSFVNYFNIITRDPRGQAAIIRSCPLPQTRKALRGCFILIRSSVPSTGRLNEKLL